MAAAEWVAIDWGTSNVRAWGITAGGGIGFSASSEQGMGRLEPAQFPNILDQLVGDRTAGRLDVMICGMAGAREGWREAPYLTTPVDLHQLGAAAVVPTGADPRYSPRILPGIRQTAAGREDVMRGEETQLLGLLALNPGFEGTAILPGTHSKWARLAGGRVTDFSSAMTGELYDLLAHQSVLRHSVGGDHDAPHTTEGRSDGIEAGLAAPQLLSSLIFRARAAALVSAKSPGWSAGYLSGVLVAAEIAGHRDWLGDQPVPLIGSESLCSIYAEVLARLGVKSLFITAVDATIAGLTLARQQS
ncbi:MAG: 2-dehydro-3-deoxygalactonokinase [Devosia sp.]